MIGNSNGETNFPHKLLLTNTQVSKICKAFANGLSANIKFSKTQFSKMMQSYLLGDVIAATPQVIFLTRKEVLKKVIFLAPKLAPKLAGKGTEYYINKEINELNKKFILGITLTNNKIKGMMKVINSLENRGILLKGTTRKITTQEGGFLNFLRPLMTAGLSLMKSVLTPVAVPLGLSTGM